ncbi:hypothetical protein [Epilithonimonas sp.]|uniref:type IX secretion system anionic LPS delivery protein PorZ n=1 Tax=Epilithonimonas sp. TaxID=2894511 RepID=UPI0035B31BC2
MKKILLFLILSATLIKAQTSKWTDLFSYNNVLKIREDGDRLIAATENGVFYYYPGTGEIKKLSKANGLHEVKISAFDYNAVTRTGIVGYQNGSMDVITPDGIFLIVDIPLANGYNGSKKINDISINGDKAIISVGYGVSIFNVTKREFGDTAFFTTGGAYDAVNSAVLKDNTVYAATGKGLKYHELNATFPVYNSWVSPTNFQGNYKKIDASGIVAFASNNELKYGNFPNLSTKSGFSNIQDIKVTSTQIIVTDQNQVYVYGLNGSQQKNFNAEESINTAIVYNNQIFTGTQLAGIYNEQKSSFKPDGPYNNRSYRISLLNNQIWVASGGRESYNNPEVPYLGYYHYDGSKWIYPDYFKNNNQFNILDVVPNPSNPAEIYFTNFIYSATNGIFKMENDQLSKQYMETSTARPIGCVFDENNTLFCSTAFLDGLVTGTGFYYLDKSSDKFVAKSLNVSNSAQKPFAKNGILYIPVPRVGGLIIYDYNNTPAAASDDKFKLITKDNNLPVDQTTSVNVDNNDDVWIGSREGLRILSNPKSAILESNPQTDPVIIEQNGIGEELFRDAEILQIAVDSGNQKWVSILGGGVFYISPSGDKTIYQFTKSNSPLPNDTVTDIKIDEKTGKIYFATIDGIVVYQGDVSEVTSNFGNVLVYPNPVVYAQYKGNVRIRGLAQKTNIRITDAAGNLVHSAVANGGYFEWNLNNQRGVRVASGIYYVLMTNEDGTDTATAKIAVVN